MLVEKIDLYGYFNLKKPEGASGVLTTYVMENHEAVGLNRKHPAMLILPGGGYRFVSFREEEPLALAYLPYGFNAFVLNYSVMPLGYPTQLLEACMAMIYIRENAEKYNVDVDHIGAIGFSAGGHLCGCLAVLTETDIVKQTFGEKYKLAKPNAVILSYAVLKAGEYAHQGSFDVLANGDKEIEAKISLEKWVTPNSVPAYIWCTATDTCVPPQNSFIMAGEYLKNGVPFEFHVFENGEHGISLANDSTASKASSHLVNSHIAYWFNQSVEWLISRGFTTKG